MDTKKSPRKNLENKRSLFLEVGFVMVLAFVLLAFQYRVTERTIQMPPSTAVHQADTEMIQVTIPKPPPPPPPKSHEINPAPDELIDDDYFPKVDIDAYPDVVVPDYQQIEIKVEKPDPTDDIFVFVEVMPEFPGGETELFRYFNRTIRYPRMAQEVGLEGIVIIGFIVEKDGSISNVHLKRGIGGGCDEEALRAVKNMPDWIPGRQGTQAVRVRYTVPVTFRLNR
jgi:protein TonB